MKISRKEQRILPHIEKTIWSSELKSLSDFIFAQKKKSKSLTPVKQSHFYAIQNNNLKNYINTSLNGVSAFLSLIPFEKVGALNSYDFLKMSVQHSNCCLQQNNPHKVTVSSLTCCLGFFSNICCSSHLRLAHKECILQLLSILFINSSLVVLFVLLPLCTLKPEANTFKRRKKKFIL